MPNTNVPIQPNTCACPCAWIHAGDMLSSACRLLIEIRFHTPRNVPGKTMNSSPAPMNAVTSRCSFDSRSTRAVRSTNGSVATTILQLQGPREQNVVLQVHVLV